MRTKLRASLYRLCAFTATCVAVMSVLVVVFAQLRFDHDTEYSADFANVGGLETGNFVRIAGVEVGKVTHMSLQPDDTVRVRFSLENAVVLTRASTAVIRYENLIGGRFLELAEGGGDGAGVRVPPGQTIALDRTRPALDLDSLIGGFRPLFRALDPDQVNALTGALITTFQGQGTEIGSLLSQIGLLTGGLADRDRLIGDVITNLNTVLGSVGDQSKQLTKAVTSTSRLLETLAARRTDLTDGISYVDATATSVADLLADIRPPLKTTVAQTDRVAGLVLSDRDYVDRFLATLPDAYQKLGRQGLYGDYFSFYLCDVLLKVNGKGGQPVYVQVVKQPSGRCTPR